MKAENMEIMSKDLIPLMAMRRNNGMVAQEREGEQDGTV